MIIKPAKLAFLDKIVDRKTRNTIGATLGLFLFILVAYRLALSNVASRHKHPNGTPVVSHPVTKDHGAVNQLCATFSDLKPHESIVGEESITVTIGQGQLQGLQKVIFGSRVHSFLGIPYAEPPIHELRFKKPAPVVRWAGVRPATKYRAHCSQYFFKALLETVHPLHYEMSEDCLYLNVWSPNVNETSDQKRPVMAFIHGGGFIMGSSLLEETVGDALAVYGDVVVVTVNVRVGAFGFMDLATDGINGNQQIYDIVAALNWIKTNVEAFGGDPDAVTVFAQSSGAMNVALLAANLPREQRLFRRAIFQSGGPTIYDMFYEQNEKTVNRLLEELKCDGDNTMSYLCLRSKSTEEIILAQKAIFDKVATSFTPTVGDGLINLLPADLMVGDFNSSVDPFSTLDSVLFGTNKDEAAIILHAVLPKVFEKNRVNLNFTTVAELRTFIIKTFRTFVDFPEGQIAALVTTFFPDGTQTDTTENLVQKLIDFASDIAFLCPSKVLAELIAKYDSRKPIFSYRFNYRPSWQRSLNWTGVTHNAELPFVFGLPLKRPLLYNVIDIEISKLMMRVWSEFARTGNMLQINGMSWPRYEPEMEPYVDIGLKSTIGYKLHWQTCQFYKLGGELIS